MTRKQNGLLVDVPLLRPEVLIQQLRLVLRNEGEAPVVSSSLSSLNAVSCCRTSPLRGDRLTSAGNADLEQRLGPRLPELEEESQSAKLYLLRYSSPPFHDALAPHLLV